MAASALILTVGLSGAVSYPFLAPTAAASTSVAARDPQVPGCNAGEACDGEFPTDDVTVTVTQTLGTPTPEQPETTITKTITPSSKKTTKKPTQAPTKTSSSPDLQPFPTTAAPPATTAEPPPTTSSTPEQSVSLPTVAATDSTTPPPSPTQEDTATDSVELEVHSATPEFDQRTLTQKLSIPALVLVLLVLFAVLIFEGRLRRMAHAAAVRKAGPQQPGGQHPEGGGYPSGPGYMGNFPPGATAYAPIISFVPVQAHPAQPYPQQPQYPTYPEPGGPPVVLHPHDFDSYSHYERTREEYRAPFEPVIPPEEDEVQEETFHPFGPPSGAESGDEEPWRSDDPTIIQPRPGYDDRR